MATPTPSGSPSTKSLCDEIGLIDDYSISDFRVR